MLIQAVRRERKTVNHPHIVFEKNRTYLIAPILYVGFADIKLPVSAQDLPVIALAHLLHDKARRMKKKLFYKRLAGVLAKDFKKRLRGILRSEYAVIQGVKAR